VAGVRLFEASNWTDSIYEQWLPLAIAEVEILKPDATITAFDPETNTGGVRTSKPVYKGKARVQMFSNNRDHLGVGTFNPNSEVGIRVQVDPHTGWVENFNNPNGVYTSDLGTNAVIRDWKIKIINGGENPSLTNRWLVVDTFVNASSRAVVDIVCTMNSDSKGDYFS
jgi:hypothetical protein